MGAKSGGGGAGCIAAAILIGFCAMGVGIGSIGSMIFVGKYLKV